MKTGSRDLTQGNITLQLLHVALPILLGQLLQNLYNTVDSLIVGNYVGTIALAAVTACSDISNLVVNFFVGLSIGAGVLFSSSFGAKDYTKLHRAIHTAISVAAFVGLFMAITGIIFAPQLLRISRCPSDVFPSALIYLRIYLIGVFFTSLYNIATGVLRAVGNTRTPLLYLIISCCTNIVLDLLFVAGFGWSIYGVAIATIISQSLTVCLIFRKMLVTRDVYRLIPSQLGVDPQLLKEILRLGLPAAVQHSLIALSNLFIHRYINAFGSTAMAGTGIAMKIDKYVSEVAKCIGTATSIFVSQNVGAKNFTRVRRGLLSAFLINAFGIAALGIPIYYSAGSIVGLFLKDPGAIEYGILMVTTIIPCYYLQATYQIFTNAIRGFGRSLGAMLISLSGLIICRQTFLAIAMPLTNHIRTVYISFPVGWGCTAVISALIFLICAPKLGLTFKKTEVSS